MEAFSPVSKWADWLQYPQSSAQPPVLIDSSWDFWTALARWADRCTVAAAYIRSGKGASWIAATSSRVQSKRGEASLDGSDNRDMARLHSKNTEGERAAHGRQPRRTGQGGPARLAQRAARLAFPVAALAITALALTPGEQYPPSLMGWHVINHIAAFAVLSGLLRVGWPHLNVIALAGGLLAYGIVIELVQALPAINRTTSLLDVMNDMIGIALGLAAAWVFARLIR